MRFPVLVLATATFVSGQVRIYVANSDDSRITVIDPVLNKIAASVPVSENPRALAGSEDGRRLYVASGRGDVVDVIDTNRLRSVRTIPVGHTPGGLAITPDGRRLFICLDSRASIEIVDTAL